MFFKFKKFSIFFLILFSLIFTLSQTYLPFNNNRNIALAGSNSVTWTNTGDFSQNRSSPNLCQQVQNSNIRTSGTPYTDPTCTTNDADGSVSLNFEAQFLTNVIAIDGGSSHSLALRNDGTVWGWGNNTSAQLGDNTQANRHTPVQVRGVGGVGFLTNITQISAGDFHSLALRNDGTVWGWGSNNWGQLGDNTTFQRLTPVQVRGTGGVGFLTSITHISAGSTHSLALRSDGTVWAWGDNWNGQLGDNTTFQRLTPVQVRGTGGVGFLTSIVSISSLGQFSLALRSDGTVWAWGDNWNGQLGDNSTTQRNAPVQVRGVGGVGFLTNITQISAGHFHSMARMNDGTVWAWGDNWNGQLGDNSTTQRNAPVQVRGVGGVGFLTNITAVSVVSSHSLALRNDGTVWGWGSNDWGQLGDNTKLQRNNPVQVLGVGGVGFLTNITAISASVEHSVTLRNDGTVWAWGRNDFGQSGDNTSVERLTPVQVLIVGGVKFLNNITQISAGQEHSLALRSDGTVWAWGSSTWGQLGDNTTARKDTPVQVLGVGGVGFLSNITHISASSGHSLALRNDGTVWAWGDNSNGQLGDNTTTNRHTPVQVLGVGGVGFLSNITHISASTGHSLALRNDGTVWAWGSNLNGQLGDNTTTNRHTPVQVLGAGGVGFLSNITSVSSGLAHSLALRNDGTVWAWGDNSNGQLGDNTTVDKHTSVQVLGVGGVGFLSNITHISASSGHSLALRNDGTVWAWGGNWDGRLGDNTTTHRHTPVQVLGVGGVGFLSNITQISARSSHSLALRNDGTVWAWGENFDGQLGDNTTDDKHTPVQALGVGGVGFLSNITSVSSGLAHSLALRNDGTVWAWGRNWWGQLGNNTGIGSRTPIRSAERYFVDGLYLPSGTLSNLKIDSGVNRQSSWSTLSWNTDPLPADTRVSFNLRTSNDETNWSSWSSSFSQNLINSTSSSGNLSGLTNSRFLEVRVTLESLTGIFTPVLNSFTVTYNILTPPASPPTPPTPSLTTPPTTTPTTTPSLTTQPTSLGILEPPKIEDQELVKADGSFLKNSAGILVLSGETGGWSNQDALLVTVSNLSCLNCTGELTGRRIEVQYNPVGENFTDETTNTFLGDSAGDPNHLVVSTATLTNLDSGSYHLRLRVKDDHQRVSSWSSYGNNTDITDPDFSIDKINPEVNLIKLNQGNQTTERNTIQINLGAEDTLSGLSEMRFANEDLIWSSWEPFSVTKNNWNLKNQTGTRTVFVQVKDNADNISPKSSDTIVLGVTSEPTSNRNQILLVTILTLVILGVTVFYLRRRISSIQNS